MVKLLFDTNILIDVLRIKFFNQISIKGAQVYISAISVYEIYSGKSMEISERKKEADILLKTFNTLKLDDRILKKAGELSRSFPNIEDIDLIIAATAIVHDMTLFTLNYKHFKDIPGLKILTDKDLN